MYYFRLNLPWKSIFLFTEIYAFLKAMEASAETASKFIKGLFTDFVLNVCAYTKFDLFFLQIRFI